MANVLDLDPPTIGLGNVNPVLTVNADCGGILDLGLIGKASESQAIGDCDFFIQLGRDQLGVEGDESRE